MRVIRGSFSWAVSFEKLIVFRKVFFFVLVFASAFYFHHWSGQQNEGLLFSGAVSEAGSSRKKETALQSPFNINTASSEDLISLPGIGPKLAELILKDREQHGPFLQLNDLLRVRGIGPKKLEKMAPFLHFDAPQK